MARRKKEHEIGDRGVKIVTNAAPDNWVHQEQSRDYGVDLKFEVFHEERTTGLDFGVQVRGSDSLHAIQRDGKQFVTCRLEVENLRDHLEKRKYPVYLFRVDNTTETIYWAFLQQHALEVLKPKWRDQKTVTIRIPVEQRIDDVVTFESALRNHVEFVRELHPSSVAAAIDAEKTRMEAQDPRFEVGINATTNGTQYFLTPKQEGIRFKFHVKGENGIKRAEELIDAGGKVDFESGQVEVTGMVEGWRDDYEVAAIEMTRKAPAMIRFSATDDVEAKKVILDVNGEFSGGMKRGEFRCALRGGPLSVVLPLDSEKTESPFDLKWDFSEWAGIDVRVLPNLDTIAPFFELVASERFSNRSSFVEMEVFL